MPAQGHFSTYHPLRSLRPQPPRIAPHRPATSRRAILKRLFVVTAVIVFGVVLFSVENTAKLLADVTAKMVVPSIPQFTQASQTPSDSGVSSIAKSEPIASEDRVSTVVEPARTSVEAATSETVLRQFQAWAAEQDAQQVATVQPVQDHSSATKIIPDQPVEGTTGSIGLGQNDVGSRSIPKARKRVSPKKMRQTEGARVQAAPTQRNGAKLSQASVGRNEVAREPPAGWPIAR
jgi:hypothetical protein